MKGEGRKFQVFITKRRRGRSFWIRFGEEGTRILLKGVESFRSEADKNSRGLEWRENGRRYSLELRKNDVGRFILCLIANVDRKRHRLFFPEGNGLINGWTLLEKVEVAIGRAGSGWVGLTVGWAKTRRGQNWPGFFGAKILTAQPALKTGPVGPNSLFKAKKNPAGPGRAGPNLAQFFSGQ